jgi:ADP-ribose pyrophosphatase
MVEIIGSKELFSGLRFRVVREEYKHEDKRFKRDVVVFPDSVVILPVLKSDEIILIRQFRGPVRGFIYEAPAGVVEEGEAIEDAARRELEEEIGYVPGELIEVGSFYPVPGYSTEKMHMFIARGLEYVGMKPEPYEIIKPLVVRLNDAIEMVKRNEITDLKTAFLILFYAHYMWKKEYGED